MRNKSLVRILLWPLKIFNTRIRLAFGLAVSVFSLVMVAQVFKILPDANRPMMDARKLQTETLAITGSALAESSQNLRDFKKTLENTLDRADDLISIGLRRSNGKLDIAVGDHSEHWQMPKNERSNDRFMFVPIFRGDTQIGQLELCYEPLGGFKNWLQSPAAVLGGFLFVATFIIFNFLLHRTLKQLDPRGAVPRRVREAFDNMAEGLLILDRTGRIMLANGKFGSLVGVDAEKLTGMSVADFQWGTVETELPWTMAVRKQQSISDAMLVIVDTDDVERTFRVSAAPVLGHQGSSRGVMVTFDDVTALEEHKRELIKARNEADAANQSKSNFLSRMSHEIRTPMNAIIGYTDILQQGEVSQDDQFRYLTTIQSSGEHLLALINDILDLSKVEAGKLTIERRSIRLIPLLNQVIETLNVKASAQNLYLHLTLDGQVPDTVETDETRLRQILINIIGNAIKFTNDGGVQLVAMIKEIDDRHMLQFDVVDTGIGISEEAMESIFDPFSQADDSVTRRFGGTGLGLAISKQLSESLGGGISVTSEPGVGTVFTITIDPGTLPEDARWITNETLEQELEVVPVKRSAQRRIEGGHALIVDDGKANRDLAGLMLKRLGMTFDMAANGVEALEKIAGNTGYDVVLMDMNMPIMDGMTATKHIRQAGLKLPVVALTALASADEKQKCLDSGCDRFLAKPIRQEALMNVLAEFLDVTDLGQEQKPEAESTQHQTPASEIDESGKTEQVPQSADTALAAEPSSDIESGLADTLASLGFGEELGMEAARDAPGDLQLPDAVRTSLPPEADYLAIVNEFAERLPTRMPEFDEALAANAMKELSDLGHWLAGAAASVGFDDFIAPARELEYSDGSDMARVSELVQHIKELCNRVEVPELTA